MQEEWKRLVYNEVDYGDRYLISNYGRVKNSKTGYIRNFSLCGKNQYYQFNFRVDGKNRYFKVHRAVAFAFIPNPNSLPNINHKDGNKLNNRVDNLEWVSQHENNIHAVIMRLSKSGEDSDLAKLSKEQVEYIKENCIPYDNEFGCKALAEKFNVDRTTISKIIHNYSWKEYKENYTQAIYHANDKNKKKWHKKKCLFCDKEFVTSNENQKYCSQKCSISNEQAISKKPSPEVLEFLICNNSFIQIGKMLEVSDNAVRKWCKLYGLPYRRKDIILYKQNMFDIKHA